MTRIVGAFGRRTLGEPKTVDQRSCGIDPTLGGTVSSRLRNFLKMTRNIFKKDFRNTRDLFSTLRHTQRRRKKIRFVSSLNADDRRVCGRSCEWRVALVQFSKRSPGCSIPSTGRRKPRVVFSLVRQQLNSVPYKAVDRLCMKNKTTRKKDHHY